MMGTYSRDSYDPYRRLIMETAVNPSEAAAAKSEVSALEKDWASVRQHNGWV